MDYEALERVLGHTFQDKALLEENRLELPLRFQGA